MKYQVILFYGDNCPWCCVLKPLFKQIKEDNTHENVSFHEVDTGRDEETTTRLRIRSIPTILVMEWDNEIARISWPQQNLKEWIYSNCTNDKH